MKKKKHRSRLSLLKPVLTDHVPKGFEVCHSCCYDRMGLEMGPGLYRDIDYDSGVTKFPVCTFCAGTGLKIPVDQSILDKLRCARYGLAFEYERVRKQYEFHSMLYFGPDLIEKIDELITALNTTTHPTEALIKLAKYVEWGINTFFGDKYKQGMKDTQYMAKMDPESAGYYFAQLRDTVTKARTDIRKIFPEGSPDLKEKITQELNRMYQKMRALERKLESPLLVEEFQLLCLCTMYWRDIGRPEGCYAQQLEQELYKFLTPALSKEEVYTSDLDLFWPEEMPKELASIDPKELATVLTNLHDLLKRFGSQEGDLCCRFDFRGPEIHMSTSSQSHLHGLIIIGEGGMTTEQGFHCIISKKPTMPILWDKRIPFSDLKEVRKWAEATFFNQDVEPEKMINITKISFDPPL